MPTIMDNCDECGAKQVWAVNRNLRHDNCPACGMRHLISLTDSEANMHKEMGDEKKQEMREDLEALIEELPYF